jgi:hypothetical protein
VLFLLGVAGALAVAVVATSIDWAAFRFADDLGASAGAAALGYVAVTVGMTIGRFAGDQATVWLGPSLLAFCSAALTGGGLALATLIDGRSLNLAGYLVAGVGIATMLPAIYDRAARHPGRPGAGLGALTAGIRLAGLTIPLLVGSIAATSLSVGSAIAMVTLPSALGFALVGHLLRAPAGTRPVSRV